MYTKQSFVNNFGVEPDLATAMLSKVWCIETFKLESLKELSSVDMTMRKNYHCNAENGEINNQRLVLNIS